MRILLVEDDPLNVDLFTAVLEDDGHQLTVERDGETGKARALGEAFDLLILDIQLPRLRGDELCCELRAAGLAMPIIGLSAEALPDQVAANNAAGFDDYLTKPISPSALRQAVRRFRTATCTANGSVRAGTTIAKNVREHSKIARVL